MTADRWKAVRKGPVYCAPACGNGCTKAEHDTAKKKVALLCEALGPKWQPLVHENMGWHFRAKLGCAEVHQAGVGGYTCFFNSRGGQVLGEGKTPKAAVLAATKIVNRKILSYECDLKIVNAQ